jgi:hypothetical protein
MIVRLSYLATASVVAMIFMVSSYK